MRIALDAMGTDDAPRSEVAGAIQAIREPDSDAAEVPLGSLNRESPHVQFFRLPRLSELFGECGLRVAESRGRVMVCGPYADFWMWHLPFRESLMRANGNLADHLPLRWAAGWMFRLERRST